MLIYVWHKGGDFRNIKKAREILRELQVSDLYNTYICPALLFQHLGYDDVSTEEMRELRLDVLSACDKLIIAGGLDAGAAAEIDFAKLANMEVELYETDGNLRAFDQ